MTGHPLLDVENLTTVFHTDEGTVRAVDGVSFTVDAGETVCLVGESGSGKTVTGESITGLIESPPGEIAGGHVRFKGRDLTELSGRELRSVRGAEIAHVFQNPQDSLNPVYRVGAQIAEVVRIHEDVGRRTARRRAVELLDRVGIPDPGDRVDSYPHELSGGMKQRVMIAIALAGRPDLLVADEPTTALDVTIQADILALFSDLQDEMDLALLFVTHDLGVVAQIADDVVVMYAGKVMERASAEELFEAPAHPYTRALLACLPGRGRRMRSIGGELPGPIDPPPGCRFAGRCPFAIEDCRRGEQPALAPVAGDGAVEDAEDAEDAKDTDLDGDEAADLDGDAATEHGVDGTGGHDAACLFHHDGYDSDRLKQDVDWGEGHLVGARGTGGGQYDGDGGQRGGSHDADQGQHDADQHDGGEHDG